MVDSGWAKWIEVANIRHDQRLRTDWISPNEHSPDRNARRLLSRRPFDKPVNLTIGMDRDRNPIGRHAACDAAAFQRLQPVKMIPLSQDA
jgi:hypothetical protein